MKKFFLLQKALRHSRQVALKSARKRKIRLRQTRHINRFQVKRKGNSRYLKKRWGDSEVKAPRVFCLVTNPEGTIRFINTLENRFKKKTKTFVVLTGVMEIDHGAIAALLSIMNVFKVHHIPFNGNKPNNRTAYNTLEESGFYNQLFKPDGSSRQYEYRKDNQIYTQNSNKKVDPELGMHVMKYASETIWKENRVCKGLQRVLLELMHNTNNHSSESGIKGTEHWWLSVNHDKQNNIVRFVFVDYGVGIFSSLHSKPKGSKWYGWQEKMKKAFGERTNDQLLSQLLEGEIHATITGEVFRGKGLPGIKQVLDRNQISNLYIVSNNTYADISKKKYRLLNRDFSGTFFYWELGYSNENQPWTIKT